MADMRSIPTSSSRARCVLEMVRGAKISISQYETILHPVIVKHGMCSDMGQAELLSNHQSRMVQSFIHDPQNHYSDFFIASHNQFGPSEPRHLAYVTQIDHTPHSLPALAAAHI